MAATGADASGSVALGVAALREAGRWPPVREDLHPRFRRSAAAWELMAAMPRLPRGTPAAVVAALAPHGLAPDRSGATALARRARDGGDPPAWPGTRHGPSRGGAGNRTPPGPHSTSAEMEALFLDALGSVRADDPGFPGSCASCRELAVRLLARAAAIHGSLDFRHGWVAAVMGVLDRCGRGTTRQTVRWYRCRLREDAIRLEGVRGLDPDDREFLERLAHA